MSGPGAVAPEYVVRRPARLVAQWTGVIGPPVVWLLFLQITYALTPWACTHGRRMPLYVAPLVAVLLALASGIVGRIGAAADPAESPVARERSKFLGQVGLAMTAMFALVIAASALATIILEPCH